MASEARVHIPETYSQASICQRRPELASSPFGALISSQVPATGMSSQDHKALHLLARATTTEGLQVPPGAQPWPHMAGVCLGCVDLPSAMN